MLYARALGLDEGTISPVDPKTGSAVHSTQQGIDGFLDGRPFSLKDHETGEFKTIRGKWFENRRLISGAGYGEVTLIARTPSIRAAKWQEQDWVTKGTSDDKPPLL
ncbi:MAG: hypothetical protein RBU37_24320, partial [Myxococcota bacterium]|nr:hypothetical protein [Myxococcota bacterium]